MATRRPNCFGSSSIGISMVMALGWPWGQIFILESPLNSFKLFRNRPILLHQILKPLPANTYGAIIHSHQFPDLPMIQPTVPIQQFHQKTPVKRFDPLLNNSSFFNSVSLDTPRTIRSGPTSPRILLTTGTSRFFIEPGTNRYRIVDDIHAFSLAIR